MILLFGEKAAAKSAPAKSNSSVKSHPVENSGILAMSLSDAKSLLTIGEYDTYISSNPSVVNYALYSNCSLDSSSDTGFMCAFSSAVAVLGGSDFGGGAFDCGGGVSYSSGASCSSFSSVG